MSPKLPPVTQALLDHLNELYPDRMPSVLDQSAVEVAYAAGQVSVVRKLKAIHSELQQSEMEAP
jgi:hypothetical protein